MWKALDWDIASYYESLIAVLNHAMISICLTKHTSDTYGSPGCAMATTRNRKIFKGCTYKHDQPREYPGLTMNRCGMSECKCVPSATGVRNVLSPPPVPAAMAMREKTVVTIRQLTGKGGIEETNQYADNHGLKSAEALCLRACRPKRTRKLATSYQVNKV